MRKNHLFRRLIILPSMVFKTLFHADTNIDTSGVQLALQYCQEILEGTVAFFINISTITLLSKQHIFMIAWAHQ